MVAVVGAVIVPYSVAVRCTKVSVAPLTTAVRLDGSLMVVLSGPALFPVAKDPMKLIPEATLSRPVGEPVVPGVGCLVELVLIHGPPVLPTPVW